MGNCISLEDAKKRVSFELGANPSLIEKMKDIFNALIQSDRLRDDFFIYLREGKNIGFSYDRVKNGEKFKKPSFLVIKFAKTDVDCKAFHLDFFFGKITPNVYKEFLMQRPSNKSRWLIFQKQLLTANSKILKDMCVDAYKCRKNIL